MKEFNTFSDFRFNIHLIPEAIALDVMIRINDWLISGGTLEDRYIKQQLKFASNFIKEV